MERSINQTKGLQKNAKKRTQICIYIYIYIYMLCFFFNSEFLPRPPRGQKKIQRVYVPGPKQLEKPLQITSTSIQIRIGTTCAVEKNIKQFDCNQIRSHTVPLPCLYRRYTAPIPHPMPRQTNPIHFFFTAGITREGSPRRISIRLVLNLTVGTKSTPTIKQYRNHCSEIKIIQKSLLT